MMISTQAAPLHQYIGKHLERCINNGLIQYFLGIDARPRRVVPRVQPVGKRVHEPVEAVEDRVVGEDTDLCGNQPVCRVHDNSSLSPRR